MFYCLKKSNLCRFALIVMFAFVSALSGCSGDSFKDTGVNQHNNGDAEFVDAHDSFFVDERDIFNEGNEDATFEDEHIDIEKDTGYDVIDISSTDASDIFYDSMDEIRDIEKTDGEIYEDIYVDVSSDENNVLDIIEDVENDSIQDTGNGTEKHYGWDYNLTHRCVRSPHPQKANYYEDLSDCPFSGKGWVIAVESEKELAVSCPGPADQSFPINSQDGPVFLTWYSHTDEYGNSNWSVNLKTDFVNVAHPCGGGYFTWYVIMDHIGYGGGPFPEPDNLIFSAIVNMNFFVPDGAARGIVAWQGWWDGKARMVEINIVSKNWGDAHPDPDIVNIIETPDMQFVNMDGMAMGQGIQMGVDTNIVIEWHKIIKNLTDRGILSPPSGGWSNTATSAIFVGSEVRNNSEKNSVIGDIWLTNFRISALK